MRSAAANREATTGELAVKVTFYLPRSISWPLAGRPSAATIISIIMIINRRPGDIQRAVFVQRLIQRPTIDRPAGRPPPSAPTFIIAAGRPYLRDGLFFSESIIPALLGRKDATRFTAAAAAAVYCHYYHCYY